MKHLQKAQRWGINQIVGRCISTEIIILDSWKFTLSGDKKFWNVLSNATKKCQMLDKAVIPQRFRWERDSWKSHDRSWDRSGPIPALALVHPAEGVTGQLLVMDTMDTAKDGLRTTGKERRTEILKNPSLTRGWNLPKMTKIKPYLCGTSSYFVKVRQLTVNLLSIS